MKTYNVRVNGVNYVVEIEETISATASSPLTPPTPDPYASISSPPLTSIPQTPTPPMLPAAPDTTLTPAPTATHPAPQQETTPETLASLPPESVIVVTCPLPGTVLSINIQPGSNVKAGQVLLSIEAMKMENEILAPKDGTISQVAVSAGQTVNSGDVLIVMS